jgi:hypothetical protein
MWDFCIDFASVVLKPGTFNVLSLEPILYGLQSTNGEDGEILKPTTLENGAMMRCSSIYSSGSSGGVGEGYNYGMHVLFRR